jgi:3'(2'), 5'-bisphosphate nucleotidase
MEREENGYEHELDVACRLAREAGALALEYYDRPLHVEQKMSADDEEPVTEADRAANALIVGRIRHEFPEDGILAEESIDTARRLGKSRVWMIDPLDGTNGFIARNGDFAVQIGLAVEGSARVGVVYQPLADVLYWAAEGSGTWIERPGLARERARVSELRRCSVGVKVGLIIERQCDLYVHLSPRTKQWDTCAPEVILTEAGGTLTDLFGYPLSYNSPDVQNRNGIVASNGAAHERVISQLAPLLTEFRRERVVEVNS